MASPHDTTQGRRSSNGTTSKSPTMLYDNGRASSPPPRPSASRMSLSALVNSPPPPTTSRPINPTSLSPPLPSFSSTYSLPVPSTVIPYTNAYTPVQPDPRSYFHGDRPQLPTRTPSYEPYPTHGGRGGTSSHNPSPSRSLSPTKPYTPLQSSSTITPKNGQPSRPWLSFTPTLSAQDVLESRKTINGIRYDRVMRNEDDLKGCGNEDVWEEKLDIYQTRREREVDDIAVWAVSQSEKKKSQKPAPYLEDTSSRANSEDPLSQNIPPAQQKRRGWPADHPTRIAQREAKEARIAAGLEPPKKKSHHKKPAGGAGINKSGSVIAGIDDELLGLAEGDVGGSSPLPPSSHGFERDGEEDDERSIKDERHYPEAEASDLDPDPIIYPCGLRREQVIYLVSIKDLSLLTEADVKAVQDEMWLREKNGQVASRKDGTLRKKPGPAKGWKKLREAEGRPVGERSSEVGSEAGDSVNGSRNGEAEADIAALLLDENGGHGYGHKSKRRRLESNHTQGSGSYTDYGRYESDDELRQGGHGDREDGSEDSEIDDQDLHLLGLAGGHHPSDSGIEHHHPHHYQNQNQPPSEAPIEDGPFPQTGGEPKKKYVKNKEPGVGKGRWTRPVRQDIKKIDYEEYDYSGEYGPAPIPIPLSSYGAAAGGGSGSGVGGAGNGGGEGNGNGSGNVELSTTVPNSFDPRGISEAEARVRLGLVEELQRMAWAGIVRDIPRMYRVNQAYDSAVKQNAVRTSQACMRNAFQQRGLKPTFRSVARINKDAATKARRVVKEMLVYWRKNEKDELAARKKAEKEALDRAKAEEEARESKRQSRKLNFLLTQTELYSHFIGKKIKTHEAELLEGDDAAGSGGGGEGVVPKGAEHEVGEDGEVLPDIDYDDDDEENLRRHAAKGAQAAIKAAKDKARAFDDATSGSRGAAIPDDDPIIEVDGDELNFQNPSMGQDQVTITQPKMLMAQLKEYQLKGLTWLGNLYEQGINGILADEMGLGKTIQSISLLAYLAEHHNLWGPFLVISPSSTLHNWQQELARFVPKLKALPYWGSPKDRETLRRIWSRKNMTFNEDSPFHILVTSYQLAVQDEKYFQGMKWQYMILDEAQAIKSSSSARWNTLLSFHCRNRLLLTGTPIQNSMQELWALLHFIMPQLFDSHEEFSEWFSKDIENAAGGGGNNLNSEQLRRLHMILKPFMLRRVKKHVQKELGDKIEIDLLVDLSQRQRRIYKALRQRVSISDLMAQANNLHDSNSTKNLMNLVMQFRKVCNHPDLFERADVVSPYVFATFSQSGNLNRQGDLLYCPESAKNLIQVDIPKLLWTEGKLDVPGEESMAGSETHVLKNLMNIWSPAWISSSLKEKNSRFGFLKLLDLSPGEAAKRAGAHPLVSLLDDSKGASASIVDGPYENDHHLAASTSKRFHGVTPRVPHVTTKNKDLTPLRDITLTAWNTSYLSRRDARFGVEKAVAPFLEPSASNRSFINNQSRLRKDPLVQTALYGVSPSEQNDIQAVSKMNRNLPGVPPKGLLLSAPEDQSPIPSLRVPAIKRLIVDSAKLARLDDLLRELKAGGHRVLVYFQMTRMMDLVEEYLIYRQYKYLRLDGSSPIGERRDMVTSWQTNPDIFVFCLSTRAGGLGINLTAADTVVFYDHDWNPSNDAQAMDRAHRVGQTKQVTVYRLIARGTIEERIVKLARAKKDVQDIVVGTKSLTDVAKPSEIVSLFLDDEDLAESVAKRKQAEEHGYSAPSVLAARTRSKFGDDLGISVGKDDDEDDFFSMSRNPANGEDEDFGDENEGGNKGSGSGTPKAGGGKKAVKRKAPGDPEKKSHKKKVKIAVGPDGLPL